VAGQADPPGSACGIAAALRCNAPLCAAAAHQPGLTGAAGVAAGLAAALYALQCTDDSPLFVATWYPLAILIVSLLGAAAAQRLLRW
jgi:hypothetical protein